LLSANWQRRNRPLGVRILATRFAFVRISNSVGLQKADALLRKNPISVDGEQIDLANWQQRIGKCKRNRTMHHGFIVGKMELRQTEFSFDFSFSLKRVN
jgi:hypothetical protein